MLKLNRESPTNSGQPVVVRVLAAASLVALLAAAAVTLAGLAPWLFLAVFWVVGTASLAPALGWGRAIWVPVGAALLVAQWTLLPGPVLGLPLDVVLVVSLTLVDLLLMGLAIFRPRQPWRLPRPALFDLAWGAAPALLSGAGLLVVAFTNGIPIAWAMRGDAQFNTVLARIVGADGGVTSTNIPVMSLAQGLMGAVHLPGRASIAEDDLLIHDVGRQAILWVVLILVSSLLAAAIAQRALGGLPRAFRVAGMVGSAVVPLSWHMTGFAMDAGFYNANLAFLVLELSIYGWLVTPGRLRLFGAAAQLGLTTVMLGAWTPMAVIPVAFAIASAIPIVTSWRRGRPAFAALVVAALAVAQLTAFAIIVILPTFLASGSLLTNEGGILPLHPFLVLATVALTAIVGFALGVVGRARGVILARGAAVLIVAVVAGIGFLLYQNRSIPQPWIYYPIKFAWLSMEGLLLVCWIGACAIVASAAGRRVLAFGALVATAVVLVSIARLNPPGNVNSVALNLPATFPLLGVALPDAADETIDDLSDSAGDRVIFSRYYGVEEDRFMDQWLFQLTVRSAEDPIRGYAYREVDTVREICDAAITWGGGVTLVTADDQWAEAAEETCGDDLTAEVRQPHG